jgi:hypothetical protein
MAAGRRLFLTHAGELAHLLVRGITRQGMALEFVRRYAERHERRKIMANAERLREMESTISREALLLITAEVRRLLPRAFGVPAKAGPEDLEFCEVFFNEFLGALGRALEWPFFEAQSEAEAFRRDLETYTKWRARDPLSPPRRSGAPDGSPFPDRCAILLDAAMMEQARRAAAEFQTDLLRFGTRVFAQLGRRASERRIPADGGTRSRKRHPSGAIRDRAVARKRAKRTNRPRRGR